jgi:hypothetical protein
MRRQNLDVPTDFPVTDFESIEALVQSRFETHSHLHHFIGAWYAVRYRFLAMTEYDECFTREIIRSGVAPCQRVRYQQERDLFGFFNSGCSVVDSLSFGLFAIGAMLKPTDFPIEPESEWKITPKYCFDKYSDAFGGDPILDTLQLMTKNGDPNWVKFSKIRNVLTHRVAPPRRFSVGDPRQPDAVMTRTNIVLDNQTTGSRRKQIASLLEKLLAASNLFLQARCRPAMHVGAPLGQSLSYAQPSFPRPSAPPPTIGGRFMTTNPARSRWSTSRFATISAIISSALWTRLRP